MFDVIVQNNRETNTISVPEGMNLLHELVKNGFMIDSPCSGNGICGKCRVHIVQPAIPYVPEEQNHLSAEEMEKGIHLACMISVTANMTVTLNHISRQASIMTDTDSCDIIGTPVIQKKLLDLPVPSIHDQRADGERLLSTWIENTSCSRQYGHPVVRCGQCDKPSENHTDRPGIQNDLFENQYSMQYGIQNCSSVFHSLPLEILQNLPGTLRKNHFQVTAIELMGQPCGVEGADTTAILYGVAVDIGTTTLAAWLYDLKDGKRLSVASMLNPQKQFGADVISRIDYASKNPQQQTKMSGILCSALNELINQLVQSSGMRQQDIYLVMLAGNTTMIHLLLNLPAQSIATAPFIPVMSSGLLLKPGNLNMTINPQGQIFILPSVSAYIGADTAAAVLSTRMHRTEEITLLVDIGTNGEIVLGNKDFLVACSTAAGPAFEGANIACGTGGVEGAVSEVSVASDGNFLFNTIGGQKPIGICGSGLIDVIACMLQTGILDETGRIQGIDELDDSAAIHKDRLFELNGQQAFMLVAPKNTGDGKGLYITQKDVREVQNAKAAIAAGINVLVREAGLNNKAIESVYLAGGFGSFMRIESAVAVGLLPKENVGRIFAVGNAAGAGTIRAMLSREDLIETEIIAKRIQYLELSSRQDFVYEYTENMLFNVE